MKLSKINTQINEDIIQQLNNCQSVILKDREPQLVSKVEWKPKYTSGLLVKPIVVGVCQSDIKEVTGQREGESQFGHELVGTVVDKWGDIAFDIGDIVCYDPNILLNRGSGFSRLIPFDSEPEALENAIYKVSGEFDVRRLVFAEPLSCALHCISNITNYIKRDNLSGYSIGVIGAGNAGILIGMSASKLEAEVVIINRDAERLSFLEAMKFFPSTSLKKIDGKIDPLDIVIITTTFITEDLLKRSFELIKENGIVVLYGGTKESDRLEDTKIDINTIRKNELIQGITWKNKKIKLLGSYGTDSKSYSKAISWLKDKSDNKMKLEKLITKEISLEEFPNLLKDMVNAKTFGKVIVKY
jgi:threonine dehydrogenase-like Zn-dependent dehydrogenase